MSPQCDANRLTAVVTWSIGFINQGKNMISTQAIDRTSTNEGISIIEEDSQEAGFRFSVIWGLIALASIVLLGIFVPSGLMLLGFLAVIVSTHEAGHYFAAKRGGILPTEFFWGFGPEVISFEKNGCRYGIKVLALGGYVKLEGMANSSELPDGFKEEDTFRSASHRARLWTILAGPAVNLVSAFTAFMVVALMKGESFLSSILKGFEGTWFVIVVTVEALGGLVTNIGGYTNSIFGDLSDTPVRFASFLVQANISQNVVNNGISPSLFWFGILSCAIGILNLLPLPPLDGFHAFAAVTEGIVQKVFKKENYKFNSKKFLPVAYVTVAALILLSLSALIMDYRSFRNGEFVIEQSMSQEVKVKNEKI